jgi:soluble lytic murein transglycosylase-like protein
MVDAKKIAGVIVDVADEYGHDYALIASIIAVESNFNPDAHNHRTNCIGLMQVRPVTEPGANVWLSELKQEQIASYVKDLKVDWRNTKAGCYILAKCKEVTPNTYRAVMRYNGGMDLNYLSSVMGNYLAIADKPMR